MDGTHALAGGGIRSQGRLQVGSDVHYTNSYNTNSVGAAPPDVFGSAAKSRSLERGMSSHDAEVHMLHEAAAGFMPVLSGLKAPTRAVMEFHGNHGPCDGCKERLVNASKEFASLMPPGSTLNARVIYSREAHDKTRGKQPTTYGYSSGTTTLAYGKGGRHVHGVQWDVPGPAPLVSSGAAPAATGGGQPVMRPSPRAESTANAVVADSATSLTPMPPSSPAAARRASSGGESRVAPASTGQLSPRLAASGPSSHALPPPASATGAPPASHTAPSPPSAPLSAARPGPLSYSAVLGTKPKAVGGAAPAANTGAAKPKSGTKPL
jgi:hypothetical protein